MMMAAPAYVPAASVHAQLLPGGNRMWRTEWSYEALTEVILSVACQVDKGVMRSKR